MVLVKHGLLECRSCYKTPVFYEFIGEHPTGGECKVTISEINLLAYMKSHYSHLSDSECISFFCDVYKATRKR